MDERWVAVASSVWTCSGGLLFVCVSFCFCLLLFCLCGAFFCFFLVFCFFPSVLLDGPFVLVHYFCFFLCFFGWCGFCSFGIVSLLFYTVFLLACC